MDTDEIWLLLKEQATANQRQTEVFQAQMATLQATKGLFQVARNGGGGELVSPIPRAMRSTRLKYAAIAAPLSNSLQKQGFKWGKLENKVFDDLKIHMSEATILGLPNFEEMFVVEANPLDIGIGVMLMHRGQPLCYFSWKLGPRMRIGATYQKNYLLLLRSFISGANIYWDVVLLYAQIIRASKSSCNRPGVTNGVADTLSHVFEEEEAVTNAFMALSQPLTGLMSNLRRENEALEDYNTGFHSSIKMTPYQAVYGRVPSTIIPYLLGSSKDAAVEESLIERDALLCQLKQNLLVTKHRMEMQANQKGRDFEFNTGDMVLVKLQPYRQVTLAKRHSNKLAKRYYGPFKVLERVGKVAYRLALPDSTKIHHVFHVSLLKPFSGAGQEPVTDLSEDEHEG
nr:Ty3/gypsy retrotransposon protein [Tanacetum cinerariifolium]